MKSISNQFWGTSLEIQPLTLYFGDCVVAVVDAGFRFGTDAIRGSAAVIVVIHFLRSLSDCRNDKSSDE